VLRVRKRGAWGHLMNRKIRGKQQLFGPIHRRKHRSLKF
jgi:hypothetical protein